MLVSGVQHSDLMVCVCVYIWPFLFVILTVIIISEFIREFSNDNLKFFFFVYLFGRVDLSCSTQDL